jgi:peptidoglycan/LPS O-acetylase OafA/YrhL
LSLTARAERDLDLLRGGAALLVFVSHLRAIFLVDLPQSGWTGFVPRLIYAATGLGQVGVLLFFVLSGYLVARSYARSPADQRLRRYAVARASRILTVYWPALILGGALDVVGARLFPALGLYGPHPADNLARGDVWQRLTLPVFAGNAGFVQTMFVPVVGTNLPLWSMAYEVWFYLAFALAMLVARRRVRESVPAAIALFALAFFAGTYAVAYFGLWLVGASLTLLPTTFAPGRAARMVAAVIAIGAIAVRRLVPFELLGDSLVAVAFAWVIATRVSPNNDREPGRITTSVSRALASVSFSLYLTHVPALSLLAAALAVPPRWVPTAKGIAMLGGVAFAAVAYATLVWFLVERRTPSVRAWMARRLGLGSGT